MTGLRVVLLGAPGSGKGTQGKLLEKKHGVPHLAAGDILRQEIARGSDVGRKARGVIERGELLEDCLIISVMTPRLEAADCAKGWILDGYPRTIPQAQALEEWLQKRNERLTAAIFFDLTDDEILRRLSGRWTCSGCGVGYHVVFQPPRTPEVCDRCGGKVIRRSDDDPVMHRKRIHVYRGATAPLLGFYDQRKLLKKIDGAGSVDEVFERMCSLTR